jgi:hypothetical protein
MHADILKSLNAFSPITLKELDGNNLMSRNETKYAFPESQLSFFLEQLKNDYRVLDVSGILMSRYESLYFDTENLDLFHHHQCGKSNRYKIRYRKYVESDLSFFEIKFKDNKGKTIKDRVRQDAIERTIGNDAETLLHRKTPIKSSELLPQFWANYTRITLVNNILDERVTLDINLAFQKGNDEYNFSNLLIAEVKQDKIKTSSFITLMKNYHVREGTVSKYCLGVISTNNGIRQGSFKPDLRNINKILHGTSTSN